MNVQCHGFHVMLVGICPAQSCSAVPSAVHPVTCLCAMGGISEGDSVVSCPSYYLHSAAKARASQHHASDTNGAGTEPEAKPGDWLEPHLEGLVDWLATQTEKQAYNALGVHCPDAAGTGSKPPEALAKDLLNQLRARFGSHHMVFATVTRTNLQKLKSIAENLSQCHGVALSIVCRDAVTG